jgi:hypothetical protein
MMNAMGPTRRPTGRTARLGVVLAACALGAGCSAGDPPDEDDRRPSPESVALRVQTVSGAEQLDEETRAEVEAAVGDVLSDYVVEAFLGEFPRQDFVQSFESFTSNVARSAAEDIDRLTAAQVRDATAVRATDLDARLSFLTQSGTVHGGTARVHFAFEATMEDGSTRPLVLDGRFLLDTDADRGKWSIFGYDIAFDNGAAVDAETSEEGS